MNPNTNQQQKNAEGGMMDTVRQTASGVVDQARQTASGVADQARGYMDQARETAREAMRAGSEPMSMPRPEHREGPIARAIEQQTAKIPSDAFLWAAVGSIGLSLALELSGKEKTANFVGHWAPTLLILGLYNKMVKLQGSDGI